MHEYRRAESILDDLGFLVPLGEGRGSFLGDRSRSARWGIDLLVRLGRRTEALAMARTSRRRLVAALARTARVESFDAGDRSRWEHALGTYRMARAELESAAKDDWKLPQPDAVRARASRTARENALRASLDEAMAIAGGKPQDTPAPSSATMIVFHPVRHGWVELVADGGDVSATFVPKIDVTVAELLAPVKLDGRPLAILPYETLHALDFHAASIDGRPLLARAPVSYPLDLPEAAPSAGDHALVVFDPTLDLEASRHEAEQVSKALRAAGWTVDELGGAEATSAAVLDRLGSARLFHYAGHGVFAGREAWESELPLAAGGKLTLADILAAPHVPERVVLSGCDTARAAADAPESLGMAQAFVIRGASFAIAPTRPIDDRLAPRLMALLYAGLAARGPIDAARLLRDAQLHLLGEAPDLDWSAFRLVSR